MFDAATRTCIHLSMPPDAVDWANLQISGCRLVQIPWALALYRDAPDRPTLLYQLCQAGYGVILRMNVEDAQALGFERARLQAAVQDRLRETAGRGLWGIILFNEPDLDENGQPIDLRRGSPSWQERKAWVHAHDTNTVREAFEGRNIRLCGAPMTNRHRSEDDVPEPGLLEWWARLKGAYHEPGISAVGCHIYEERLNDDPAAIDTTRAKHKLYLWGSMWQPELWIDEFQVTRGTDVERMQAFISFLRLCARHPARVGMASQFVANGTGQHYDPRFIVRDPAAYALLGRFLTGR